MSKSVGLIGLGIMGGAMARNLSERGWQVTGFDLDLAKCEAMAQAGVDIVASPAEVANAAPCVITSLPSPAALTAVGAALCDTRTKGVIVIETSTLALPDKLAFAQPMIAAGHRPLDCPLSGTGAQAQARDLIVYASGETAAIALATPVFADIAKQWADLGQYGNGSRMKFIANLLVAIHNVAAAEAMVLAMKAGLSLEQVVALVGPGAGGSRMFQLRAPMMAADTYEPATMRISTWQKDMAIIAEFAKELGVATPTFSATAPIYEQALAAGLGASDTAAVCRVLETLAGVQR